MGAHSVAQVSNINQTVLAHPSAPTPATTPQSCSGFTLTRHWRDTPTGTEIEFWFATDTGPRNIRLTAQRSVAFVEANRRATVERLIANMPGVEIRSLDLKTFDQQSVLGVYVNRYRQLLEIEKLLKSEGISLYEADIRPPERYLMERFITASVQFEGGHDVGTTTFDCKVKPAPNYRPLLRMVSLDIETSPYEDLYSVALEGCGQRQVYMLGEPPTEAAPNHFDLEYCETPRTIIEKLNAWFLKHNPDVIAGWSLIQFDLRVLQKHADKYKVPLALGRTGRPVEWRRHGVKQGYLFATTPGRLIVDGIDALKSAIWNFPSFKLEDVAQALLGEGKSVKHPYHRMDEIVRRFHNDKPALACYNLNDCDLVTRIFAKTKLLDFLVERANVTGLQADHFGGSIAAFSHHYLPRLHRNGYVAPNVGGITGDSYPGGFVMDSRPGLYDSVLVLDYKSLYASIIRTFLIDPVGLIEGSLATDPETTIPGMNGTVFSRTGHSLPDIVTELWQRREVAKLQINEPLSQALKLLMSSFCGVLGSPDCRFFDPQLVSSVTLRGHEIMRQTRKLVEDEGYDVIYGDTDSIFVWLKKPHDDIESLKVGERLITNINQWWRQNLQATLGLESALELEVDTHYHKFFMPTIRGAERGSKKRYAGLIKTANGGDEIVYRGLESARSDWTPLAQNFQQGLFSRIFKSEAYKDFVREYADKTTNGEFDDLLVYRRRLRQKLVDYRHNTPPHVRAARLADEINERKQRPLQYQNGGWISYIMTVNGPEPVEAIESKIDYEHYLSKQLQPLADSILFPMGDTFVDIVTIQGNLFSESI